MKVISHTAPTICGLLDNLFEKCCGICTHLSQSFLCIILKNWTLTIVFNVLVAESRGLFYFVDRPFYRRRSSTNWLFHRKKTVNWPTLIYWIALNRVKIFGWGLHFQKKETKIDAFYMSLCFPGKFSVFLLRLIFSETRDQNGVSIWTNLNKKMP